MFVGKIFKNKNMLCIVSKDNKRVFDIGIFFQYWNWNPGAWDFSLYGSSN